MHRSVLVALSLAAGAVLAQPTTTWVNPPGGVAVATDATDNVYTVNWDYNPAGDITLTKRSAAGVVQWEARYDNADTTRHEVATWVDTDSTGNVYVSGTVRSGYASPVNANSLLMKFAPDGSLLWRRVYDTAFDGSSTRKLLVDETDHVYVLGIGTGPFGQVSTVRKFAPNGDTVWAWFDPFGIGAPVNFKWGGDGALLISARGITGAFNGFARIDRNGQLQWSAPAVNSLTVGDIAGDAAGAVYLVNGEYVTSGGSIVTKLAPGGFGQWQVKHPMQGFRIEVGSDGAPVIGGFPSPNIPGAAFAKFDGNGNLLWANLDADGPMAALLAHAQMKLDASNSAYLAGSTMSEMGVSKVLSNGASAWTVLLPGGYPTALALGQAQQVYVVGGLTARIDQVPVTPTTADLALTLADAPDPVRVNSPLVLTAQVTNRGPLAATGLQFSEVLPRGAVFVGVTTSQGSCSGTRTVSCQLGTLASGVTASVTVTLKAPRTPGSLVTSASVRAAQADPNGANNQATTTTTVVRR